MHGSELGGGDGQEESKGVAQSSAVTGWVARAWWEKVAMALQDPVGPCVEVWVFR